MLTINLLAPLDKPEEKLTFALSPKAQSILGTDDPLLVSEAYPSLEFVREVNRQHLFTATRYDARTLCFDLNERSIKEQGFDQTPNERSTCRSHARRLYYAIYGVLA